MVIVASAALVIIVIGIDVHIAIAVPIWHGRYADIHTDRRIVRISVIIIVTVVSGSGASGHSQAGDGQMYWKPGFSHGKPSIFAVAVEAVFSHPNSTSPSLFYG